MDQSTEKLLKSTNSSPLFGISNCYDSSQSIIHDLATTSPEQSIITDTLSAFALGTYNRTRHLSCILENWSESESYNSLPIEVTQKSNDDDDDDSFNNIHNRKPMSWEAEDITEYITTLDESCILDIESIECIDQISTEKAESNPWNGNSWSQHQYRAPNEAIQKMVTVDVHTTDVRHEKQSFPKIMTTSCYGTLANPFIDKSYEEDMNSVYKSSDELIHKNQQDEFIYLNPMINNQAKCRSPLPASLSNSSSFIDSNTISFMEPQSMQSSMNASFAEPKSMQSSIEFNASVAKMTTINPLEISLGSPDESKCFGEEAVVQFEQVVDQGKYLFCTIYLLEGFAQM